MAIFNFLENFFFISLAITFGLMLMLVYHFKERITVSEKRIDTINDVLISVVKELKNIQFAAAASAAALSNSIPVVPPTIVPFPTTVVPNKLNQAWPPAENIHYDISEVNPNVDVVAPVPTKIVVSDEDDDEDDEDSEYSEESGSENEQSSVDGSEPEDETLDLGEEESLSSVDDEEDEDNDSEEDDGIPHPIHVVSQPSDDIPIKIEVIDEPISSPIELSHIVLSENQGELDLAEPMELELEENIDIDVVVDVEPDGEPEAHVSAPTTDISASDPSASYSLPIVSVELSDITEIIVPDIADIVGAGAVDDVVPSVSVMEFEPVVEAEPEPEPISEPIVSVSEPKEERPTPSTVSVSRDAKEQKKEVYRKMSIHQLRTIAISSGLSADNKMKKVDLIRLLETLDDEEDQ